MKKILLLFTVLAAFIVSCTSNNSDKTGTDSTGMIAVDTTFAPTNATPVNTTNCYAYIKNRDSATLKLSIKGEELTGDLNYRLFEKDSNKGTLTGEIKGDTIIAEYTFDSEGMRSVRQVVFLNKDGKLYEGSGDVEEKNGKVAFKNRAALKFGDAIVFTQVSCK